MWQFDNLRELLIPLPITIHFSLFNKIRVPKLRLREPQPPSSEFQHFKNLSNYPNPCSKNNPYQLSLIYKPKKSDSSNLLELQFQKSLQLFQSVF